MLKKLSIVLIVFFLGVYSVISGCGFASSPSSQAQLPLSVAGAVQKGPFVLGSLVMLQGLDKTLSPTGQFYTSLTSDDFGAYNSNGSFGNSNYIDVATQGYYYNEYTGTLSVSPITLSTLTNFSGTQVTAKVNILTTIARERIKYLLLYDTAYTEKYSEAQTTAQNEVLQNMFHIDPTLINSFNEMDMSQEGATVKTAKSNAILTAVSSIVQNGNTPGEVQEYLAKVVNAIKSTGTLTNATLTAEVTDNSKALDYRQISWDLNTYYNSIKNTSPNPALVTAKVPGILQTVEGETVNWTDYFSWDWTTYAKLNGDAPTMNYGWSHLAFADATNSASSSPMNERTQYATVTFNDKTWIIGGLIGATLKNDVWSSNDGVTWTQVVAQNSAADNVSMWTPRRGAAGVAYNGKIYMIGGYDGTTVLAELWSSSDGVEWTKTSFGVTLGDICPEDTSPVWKAKAVVFDNKLWLLGGSETVAIGGEYELACYSTNNGSTWNQVVPGAPQSLPDGVDAMEKYGVVAFDGEMWLLPGNVIDAHGDDWSATTTIYHSSTGALDSWTEATAGWTPRSCYGAEVYEDKLWILGGDAGNQNLLTERPTGKVWSMDTSGTWTQLTTGGSMFWEDRNSVITSTMQDKLWIVGGKITDYAVNNYDAYFYSSYVNRLLDCETVTTDANYPCWLAEINQ